MLSCKSGRLPGARALAGGLFGILPHQVVAGNPSICLIANVTWCILISRRIMVLRKDDGVQ
jgi:hypothetical protein